VLDLLSEFIDANADTVDLLTGEQPTELEWSAHCDYLRGLQRLGHETLTRHDQRRPEPPLALAVAQLGSHPQLDSDRGPRVIERW
jgi:hypothetical protein